MTPTTEASAVPPAEAAARRQRRAETLADDWLSSQRAHRRGFGNVLRFLLFALWALVGIVAFWLWAISGLFLMLRMLLLLIMAPLLWISDGPLPDRGGARRGYVGAARRRFSSALAAGIARHYHDARVALRRFWHLSAARKALVVVLLFLFVGIPGSYVVPRVNYVQVIDNNAIRSEGGRRVRYLIHAVDLHDYDKTREYENEYAWWLGKINPQGLKNRLQHGRYYRLWVVGIRWYLPALFPNIIAATEVGPDGHELSRPSHFVPATTTGE